MTIQDLKDQNLLLIEIITGSRAYNLNVKHSDTDIKGVFVMPKKGFYGFDYVSQINNKTNDIVYYELRKFLELLAKNNPSMLELVYTSPENILYEHPLFKNIKNFPWLTKRCKYTFGNYAESQIKKARGLNKKIVNPVGEIRKTIIDFCYVTIGQGTMPLQNWLEKHDYQQENCGLVNLSHIKGLYGLFYDASQTLGYKGILQKTTANQVVLSSIPKDEKPLTHLFFNQDGYTKYCKDFKDYWDWVAMRNEERYENTQSHGKNYDSKNMMHTFRLLNMAREILEEGKVIVKRPNREMLLDIRKGKYQYKDLMRMAADELEAIEKAYQQTSLPDNLDMVAVEKLLVSTRMAFYKNG